MFNKIFLIPAITLPAFYAFSVFHINSLTTAISRCQMSKVFMYITIFFQMLLASEWPTN